MMDTVELHAAFLWTCDECGADQFERTVTISPESMEHDEFAREIAAQTEAQNEVLDELGISAEVTWMTSPDTVKCRVCGAEFKAIQPGDCQ